MLKALSQIVRECQRNGKFSYHIERENENLEEKKMFVHIFSKFSEKRIEW